MIERVRIFEQKIEEYFLSCYPDLCFMADKSFLSEWPLYKFSIMRLYASLAPKVDEQHRPEVGEKLIDVKLHFAYLLTIGQHFDRGATVIVGNNEIEKLNPRTISLLRATHYRVYLLSVLVEEVLDLLWLVLEGTPWNRKRGKWDKIIERVQKETGQSIFTDEDAALLRSFKTQFRTAELHKFSMVRALTGKAKWTHLQEEERAAARVLHRLFAHYV